jgi:lon-related putative ATP-dependent protease
VQIQQPVSPFNPAGGFLKPEPVKIDTKIIIVGSENIYDILYNNDHDFEKFFKIIAEFDSEIDINDENTEQYIGFINQQTKKQNIKTITDEGIQSLLDYSIRLTGHRKKYTAKFSKIVDLLVEADFWASEQGRKIIDKSDVETAISKRIYMNNLPEEKITSTMEEGTIKIEVKGEKTGVVNGLAVYDRGFHTFGRPFLVSATIAPGDEGIINIEREAGLSGEIYNKAVMIIEGFLRSFYGKNFPISIFASICFEQSYGEIEGDSASSTEIYALLSAISLIPFRQDIAITGSVNQLGEIQPIGGVNEKIEGFFAICEKFGLTGTQGVIIPYENVKNLVLQRNVIEAVEKGIFFIYPVKHINDGIVILSGMEAGEADKKGNFSINSFNYLVEKNLRNMSKKSKTWR